jgi:hypothetical protein
MCHILLEVISELKYLWIFNALNHVHVFEKIIHFKADLKLIELFISSHIPSILAHLSNKSVR